MTKVIPPRWAETVLCLLLAPRDRQTVSGDLVEEYRETIYPARGQLRADVWYLTQVAEFLWRDNRAWAALLSGSFLARTALDWLVPTIEFHTRSTMSTAVSAGILLSAGFWAERRSHALLAGALAGIATTLIAAIISVIGAASLLAMWHDPQTRAAIQSSGGLEEVFTLPVMMVVPGAFLGVLGGLVGAAVRKLVPDTPC